MQQPPIVAGAGAPPGPGTGGIPPPVAQPLLQPPPAINAQPQSYRAFYANPNTDPYHGNYQEPLEFFRLPANGVNVLTPQEAANRVYLAAMQEPVALLIHGHKANAAAGDPGCI